MKKIDYKLILMTLMAFVIVYLILFPKTVDNTNYYETERDRIYTELDKTIIVRDSIYKENLLINTRLDSLSNVSDSLSERYLVLDREYSGYKRDLSKYRKKIDSLNNSLNEIINNPPNRTGSDLINSLKDKLK